MDANESKEIIIRALRCLGNREEVREALEDGRLLVVDAASMVKLEGLLSSLQIAARNVINGIEPKYNPPVSSHSEHQRKVRVALHALESLHGELGRNPAPVVTADELSAARDRPTDGQAQQATCPGFEAFKPVWEKFVAGLYPNSGLDVEVAQAQQATPQFSTEYTNGYTVGHADGYASCLRRVGRVQDAGVGAASHITDIAKELREYVSNPNYRHNDYVDKLMRSAADEVDRYYSGMMAWKKTAETKDSQLSQERQKIITERCEARHATATACRDPESAEFREQWDEILTEVHDCSSLDDARKKLAAYFGTGAAPGSLDFLKAVGDALNGGHREIIDECSGPISQAAVDVLRASAARCEEKAHQSAAASEWKGNPYLFRQVSPLPEIDYNNPLNYQWNAGEVLYAGKSFGTLSEKDKECVDNGLLPPDEAPQPASNGWPSYIKWRDQTPPPPKRCTGIKTEINSLKPYIDIEIGHYGKKYSGYVDVRESLILARDLEVISNMLKAKDGNGWPDYIQWTPEPPESPPRLEAITIFDNTKYQLVFNDGDTSKFGNVPAEHEDEFIRFIDGLHAARKTTKPRIYIAGPMSGLPELNFPAFHAEAARLRALGYEVVNPAEINAEHPGDWASCMKADIKQMLTCDGIAMLHGWTDSRGATLEHALAHDLGMVIYYKAITQEVL